MCESNDKMIPTEKDSTQCSMMGSKEDSTIIGKYFNHDNRLSNCNGLTINNLIKINH